MDGAGFDRLTKELAAPRSRRGVVKALLAGLAGITAGGAGLAEADARVRCRPANRPCTKDDHCCSGTCGAPDARGRRRCACTPEDPAVTCAGTCGKQTNTCGQKVDCAPCCKVDEDCASPIGGCINNRCKSGACTPEALNAGVVCTLPGGGGGVCDGAGACVECLQPGDCGADTECQTRTCSSQNTCGVENVADGTPLQNQTTGDCKEVVCDGQGGTTTIADGQDTPVAQGGCYDGVCNGDTPGQQPKAQGATCSENGGKVCNGAGTCVECNGDGDCARFCRNNVCIACLPNGDSCTSGGQCCGGGCYGGSCETA